MMIIIIFVVHLLQNEVSWLVSSFKRRWYTSHSRRGRKRIILRSLANVVKAMDYEWRQAGCSIYIHGTATSSVLKPNELDVRGSRHILIQGSPHRRYL